MRKYLRKLRAEEQFDAYLAAGTNPSGARAAEVYLQYFKVGAPKEANIQANLRMVIDAKYEKYVSTKKESEMSGIELGHLFKYRLRPPCFGPLIPNFEKDLRRTTFNLVS